ncbi:MAG: type II toxin-antitoxin system VapC family toxin [bacterium]|nr:type II toxin-antitoxin system VapC family toxin [bacterium]
MTVALDSWAVLCFLRNEGPSAVRVEEALLQHPVMSWINLGEVYYITMRREGEAVARRILATLLASVIADEATPARVVEASRIKARYAMAFADAFAVATAQAHRAVLLTGDPEILDADGTWVAEDLRH